MTEAQKKYKKEVKSKIITFYKHEKDLLDFANSINFQKYVKTCLRITMLKHKSFIMQNIDNLSVKMIKRDGFIYGNLKDFKKWVTPRNSIALNSII